MKNFLTITAGLIAVMMAFAIAFACAGLAEAASPLPVDPTDMSWLRESIDYVIVGICLVAGLLIKHCTPVNNRYIPLIVALLGLAIAVWMHLSAGITPMAVLSGLVSGLASTGFHQVFKQLFID